MATMTRLMDGIAKTTVSEQRKTMKWWQLVHIFVSIVFSVVGVPEFAAIHDTAQLKVDLRKAQEACEKLSDQLMTAETAREAFEKQFKEATEEMSVARKAKDNAMKDKAELQQKLQVLTTYFNQRESDLQKQLGMTANRLTDTASTSESANKQLVMLQEEVEAYKTQVREIYFLAA